MEKIAKIVCVYITSSRIFESCCIRAVL